MESKAIALRYFDRVKGRVFQHPASINFNCGRFESGWLVYTDLIETSKVRRVMACQDGLACLIINRSRLHLFRTRSIAGLAASHYHNACSQQALAKMTWVRSGNAAQHSLRCDR